ncbi:MAG: hypothetical protein ACR2MU_05800 [Gaiellaceae bacterium]
MQHRKSIKPRLALAAGLSVVMALVLAAFAAIGNAGGSAAAQGQYAPISKTPPAISGNAVEGSTLTATTGMFDSNSTVTYSFQFQRCASDGNSCAAIVGATKQTYVLQTADVGNRVRVAVQASNADGATTSNSVATPVVVSKTASTAGPEGAVKLSGGKTSIPASSVVLPARLIIDGVRFTPSVIRSRATFNGRFHVSDTRGFYVRDALVYVSVVPFGRIVQPAEVRTDQSGYATVTIQPTTRFPIARGTSVQFFLRARKSGDNLLAGVSTRRLVQVGTGG